MIKLAFRHSPEHRFVVYPVATPDADGWRFSACGIAAVSLTKNYKLVGSDRVIRSEYCNTGDGAPMYQMYIRIADHYILIGLAAAPMGDVNYMLQKALDHYYDSDIAVIHEISEQLTINLIAV